MTDRAPDLLDQARDRLLEGLPQVTFDLWLAPLRAIGERDGGLCVAGPPRVVTWVERRYLPALRKAVREVSDLRDVYVFADFASEARREAVECQ